MCGITGIGGGLATVIDGRAENLVAEMNRALTHRGPDADGVWVAPGVPLVLGHRRLSIIDLSPGSNQPLVIDGPPSTAITFNGEIYNFGQLRSQLSPAPRAWAARGDTDVLLRACAAWGPVETVRRARGMFAFAFFDGRTDTLWLGRDRFGEKPLYYALWAGGLAFASELKALRSIPSFPDDVDPVALDSFLRKSVIGGERTIYRHARKVLPGTLLQIRLSDHIDASDVTQHVYWDSALEAEKSARSPFVGDLDEAADALDEVLGRSARAATTSDMPVGALLSGGIDSTLLVSQLEGLSSAPLRTFTVGFGEGLPSEAEAARAISRRFGTRHSEVIMSSAEALDIVPSLAETYDEPFADSSQIPTCLISRFVSSEVKVALVGDGGDELFGGYPRYVHVDGLWRRSRRTPGTVRAGVARALRALDAATWDRVGYAVGGGPIRRHSGGWGERSRKAAALADASTLDEVYRLFTTSFWEQSPMASPVLREVQPLPMASSWIEQMMLSDTVGYLPDDLLTKVDRAAMSVGLETRVPFLDPDVFRLAFSLPVDLKVRDGHGKVVLKHLVDRRVPRQLWDRRKTGFSVPIGAWLRGPLRPWAQDMLSPDRLAAHGWFDREVLERHWAEHMDGRRDWGSRLWNVVMFQAWFERWGS